MPRTTALSTALCALVLATACPGDDDETKDAAARDASGGGALAWYATCGDPVCGPADAGRPTGVDACTTERVGERCTTKDQQCDPGSGCGTLLRCTDRDPKLQPGGCPISSRRFKADIRYLTAEDRRAIADELAALKLARYHYTADPQSRPRLGFIIEDAPHSPAVELDRDQVDLYAYVSMVVAALQDERRAREAQATELERLRAEVAQLRHGARRNGSSTDRRAAARK
jgi:hypothetical protein